MPNLGAARPDARSAVQLQLEESVRCGGTDRLELLFPPLSWRREEPASRRLPGGVGAASAPAAPAGMGSLAGSPQRDGPRLHRSAARPDLHRVPAALRSGAESGRIHLGSLEAA